MDRHLWAAAGVKEVPDLVAPRRYLKSLKKKGKHDLRGIAMSVLTGSHWPRDRIAEHLHLGDEER
eukprot:10371331-Lingulodinium_polyedra.AAC.1